MMERIEGQKESVVPGDALAFAEHGINRRDFLKLAGVGAAGTVLLGVAGCGGGGGGGGEFTFSFGPDPSGTLQELVDRFNTEYEGQYTASYREMPADTGQYFDQVRTEFQAGGGDIDLIGGDVIWSAQFAANGYILDLRPIYRGGAAGFPPWSRGIEYVRGQGLRGAVVHGRGAALLPPGPPRRERL